MDESLKVIEGSLNKLDQTLNAFERPLTVTERAFNDVAVSLNAPE